MDRRLFGDELVLLENAATDTVTLMHATFTVPAIKILVSAHEILSLNLEIKRHYTNLSEVTPWDRGAFKDLDRIRAEVVLRYGETFHPPTLAPFWYQQIGHLFQILNLSFV